MSRISMLTAFAVAAFSTPVLAEEATLSQPISGASFHEGALDMVAYYRPVEADAFEVVATFAPDDQVTQPRRLAMVLRDGDAVQFALPGYRGTTYSFSRAGDDATIAVEGLEWTASAY